MLRRQMDHNPTTTRGHTAKATEKHADQRPRNVFGAWEEIWVLTVLKKTTAHR